MVKIASNLNNENSLNVFIRSFEKQTNNKAININEYFIESNNDFQLTLKNNQVLFIKKIFGAIDDNETPIEATLYAPNGEAFNFKSGLLLEKNNGDLIYESISNLDDIAVIRIDETSNIKATRVIGYLIDFEKDVVNEFGLFNGTTSQLKFELTDNTPIIGKTQPLIIQMDVFFNSDQGGDGTIFEFNDIKYCAQPTANGGYINFELVTNNSTRSPNSTPIKYNQLYNFKFEINIDATNGKFFVDGVEQLSYVNGDYLNFKLTKWDDWFNGVRKLFSLGAGLPNGFSMTGGIKNLKVSIDNVVLIEQPNLNLPPLSNSVMELIERIDV